MADRYWVGGTANWDGTAGTKWSATSGGSGGASVPTSADDVFFTNLSTGTCTIATGNTGAKSINCTGFTGTLAGSAAITVSGSVTLVAGMTVTYSGTLTLNGTGTLTSAGKTLGPVTINGSGITVTLGDAFVSSGTLTLSQGTFTTSGSNYSVSVGTLILSGSSSRTLVLNASTVTITTLTAIVCTSSTNLTLNAGTSTINCTASGAQVIFGASGSALDATLYNLLFTSSTVNTIIIRGVLTVNNLSFTGPSVAGVMSVQVEGRFIINGTLSTTGTAGNRRVWIRSQTYGLARTLTINSAPSLTDADFRDIYVIGTAAPISGTRVGDLRGCRGITFSTPKTVYWNLAAGGSWSANAWAASSGGAVSTDNFPLAQDTAIIENTGLNTSATVIMNIVIGYVGTVSMGTRTNAMTLSLSDSQTIYGNWTNGSGTTLSGSGTLTFAGRNTQTITSAGKTFSGGITIDTYGGSVELADALNIGSNTLTFTNGTFDTKNFNVTATALSSNNSNVRTITLGSSTLTLSAATPVNFDTSANLTFNAGTSQITATGGSTFRGGGLTFYNVSFSSDVAGVSHSLSNITTFNNLTITAPSSAGISTLSVGANQTITGTLTVAGASPVRRIFVRSDILGATRTLSVGTLSATDCDFRDIAITGTAAGSSPTRAGNCGGNSGITFPAAKTVYWNLAGAQDWSATAWAPGTGGVPDINQFPLAQDTAVFDNTGSVTGTITINTAWNIGTFDASARTTAMTLTTSTNAPLVYGDWKFGTGVTSSSTGGTITFAKRGTQTVTSNGVQFGCPVTVDSITGTVQLADALSLGTNRTLNVTSGVFDAVSYNVSVGNFVSTNTNTRTVKMGSGTWTLTGAGTVLDLGVSTNLNFYKGTANIVLSGVSTSTRGIQGGGFSYNKLTIGGATGISTTSINGNNQFTELASTKTVAHTIALGSTTQTFGKWTVTGTAGNVVTLTGTGTSHSLVGACTSGIDYLAMGSIGFAATSPGEFYAGANSTGTAAAPVYRTAKPADSTRYWVGGTGNWSDTARWSTSSGGASGASVPRSHDDVVFDSASNATAYTATVNAVTGGIRMKALTIAGPAAGNVTLAGSTAMDGIHGNVTLPATGLTRTYTGQITLSGSSTGKTISTNGVVLGSTIYVRGEGCEWSLGGAINSNAFDIIRGSFVTNNYNINTQAFLSNYISPRSIDLGSSVLSITGFNQPVNLGTTENERASLTFNAGTSQINTGIGDGTLFGNNQTFYNVAFTSTTPGTVTINGTNSFNNLSFTGITFAGLKNISVTANQTVTGTLTFSAGTNATMRQFCRSDTMGTTRTITAAVVSMTDVDFRDITIAGAAAPASGTRIGDCKGNSGITFTAAANKYWNLDPGGQWGGAVAWATSSGGTPDINNFPLAQDTCFFVPTGLGNNSNVTISQGYNIGTIDMSARTTMGMWLTCNVGPYTIYGNWINGTGTTTPGGSRFIFAGRTNQTITSAGKGFGQSFTIDTPGGSVTLQDALTINEFGTIPLTLLAGTFDANIYNVTLTGFTSSSFTSTGSNTRTVAIGSGTWTIAGGGGWNVNPTNLTVTGTGTINLTSGIFYPKTFSGGGISYTNITLNQGGEGTLTITGNNTFKDITNTYKTTGATTINFGTTTQRVSQFAAAGESGRVLTLTGTSATSPATLILTSSGPVSSDFLTLTGIRAYPLTDKWSAGTNSTNNGTLGWIFTAAPPAVLTGSFLFFL